MVLMLRVGYEENDESGVNVPDEFWGQLLPRSVRILAFVDVIAGGKGRARCRGRRGRG